MPRAHVRVSYILPKCQIQYFMPRSIKRNQVTTETMTAQT